MPSKIIRAKNDKWWLTKLFKDALGIGPKTSLLCIHIAMDARIIEVKDEYTIKDFLKVRLWIELNRPLLIAQELEYVRRKLQNSYRCGIY